MPPPRIGQALECSCRIKCTAIAKCFLSVTQFIAITDHPLMVSPAISAEVDDALRRLCTCSSKIIIIPLFHRNESLQHASLDCFTISTWCLQSFIIRPPFTLLSSRYYSDECHSFTSPRGSNPNSLIQGAARAPAFVLSILWNGLAHILIRPLGLSQASVTNPIVIVR